ncbi:EamA family transporter RarD [Sphingomonas sp. LaA6.9]|uniref:EamA family transporter RarD n=1 Tax=Sphingomonas sp. LaA6.9 TaxID=2919914 RepID=UPI001F4F1928|nr:EamA family transporter RarD [Sphingomonas sp. LaA6.9]MCJ8156379.1 EamA family transporter RarD [Sphingomonas sp. LaA6.9]
MVSHSAPGRAGIAYGLGAYLIWGFLPAYFKLLSAVLPSEVVAQRIIWSVAFLALLIAIKGSFPTLRAALANPSALRILAATALLIAANWLIYVWAIVNSHVLESSLGYFLNPLVNVAMGVVLLKERLGRAQMIAVALAAIGVTVLAIGAGSGLWISLSLAFTFATYGLLRKIAPVESLEGLSVETLILAPFALGYLWWLSHTGGLAFGADMGISLLLAAGGIVTAVPLLLFAAAARRMPYATLGLLQYLAPTLQFLLAVFAYGEPLTTAHLICFGFIWSGLAIFAVSGISDMRRRKLAVVD